MRVRWRQVSPREQRAVLAAAVVLLLAALWWLGVAPALNTLRSAEQQHPLLGRPRCYRPQRSQPLPLQPKLVRKLILGIQLMPQRELHCK